MKIGVFILIFIFILSITFVSSEDFGYNYLQNDKNLNPISFNNNTGTVNSSIYADIWITSDGDLDTIDTNTLNNNGGVLEIVKSWWDNLYCLLTGCTMSGQLNVDNNLNVTGTAYFNNLLCLNQACSVNITTT